MEQKTRRIKASDKILEQEHLLQKKKEAIRKIERILSISAIIGLIIVILLMNNCSGKKDDQITQLTKQVDSLKNDNTLLKNKVDSLTCEIEKSKHQKAIPVVKNKKTGKVISAIIVDGDDKRPESLFIKNEIFISAVVHDSFPVVDSNCVEQLDSANKEMDNILNTVIEVSLDKITQDTSQNMYLKRLMIKELLLNSPLVYTSPSYTEYLTNPYRAKAKNSFLWGAGLGVCSAITYGISEAIGHPKYYDDQDNSEAEQKSNLILGLRISSGVLATASLIEFGRTIYFHNMESKFIVGPNKVGLSINLDKQVKK